jgi:hypothetical protein
MLLREKLEDQAQKQVELDRKVIEKKLELMTTLQQKLAAVGRIDSALDTQVRELSDKVAAWRAADEATRPKAKKPAALNVVRQ